MKLMMNGEIMGFHFFLTVISQLHNKIVPGVLENITHHNNV